MQAGDCLAEKYELVRILGRGGMGTVWLAQHRTLGTPCAVKVLGGAFEPARVSRALREARVAAKLESEHAVRMLDAGTDDEGRPWLVMEHLRGHDLAAILALHGPLGVARAASLLLGVCDAVAEAHHRGVVHRDLKPANLFLAERDDGSAIVKVLDFGIAKLLDDTETNAGAVTASGAMIGSPRYVAPEQIRSAAAADARADIWSLGVTLYELLAGTPPFVGDTSASVLAQIIADPVPPLADRVPGLPAEVAAIVDRCLQKDPGRRYPTVAKLATDLAPFAPTADRRPLARILGWTAGRNATTEDDPTLRGDAQEASQAGIGDAPADDAPRGEPTAHDTAATWSTREIEPGPRGRRAPLLLALVAGGVLVVGSSLVLRPPAASSDVAPARGPSLEPSASAALPTPAASPATSASLAPPAVSAAASASAAPRRDLPAAKPPRTALGEPARNGAVGPDRHEDHDRTW